MMHEKILIIAPYPIVKPQNGGQKRAKALFEFYQARFQETKYVSIFHRGHYPEWGEDDLPLGDPEIIAQVDKYPYATELIAGAAIDKDIHVRSYMAKILMEYAPDIIHIEQPFAYIGLKQLLGELDLHPILIFGSQNIEYPLKDRIFKELKVPNKLASGWVAQTHQLERELSRQADIVVAVNSEDAATHKQMGAKECIVATNGVEKTPVTDVDMRYWYDYKQKHGVDTLLTFVGSGHPPNWEGFLKLIGDNTNFVPARAKIIVAGGVCDYFDQVFKDKIKFGKFWEGLETVGKLEEGRLVALIESSDVLLLPITTSRGSNLKTAEAILSGKKVVATSNTFHGFESYANLPNFYIGDTKTSFKRAILTACKSDYINRSAKQKKHADKVQWNYSLAPIIPAIKKIIRKRGRAKLKARIRQTISR